MMPHQDGTPVMTDEDGFLKIQGIQQRIVVTRQTVTVIGFNRFRSAGMTISSLVRNDDVIACVRQGRYLVSSAKGMLRPAMGQHDRNTTLACLKYLKFSFSQ